MSKSLVKRTAKRRVSLTLPNEKKAYIQRFGLGKFSRTMIPTGRNDRLIMR